MTILRDGTTLMGAGLDHWYKWESGEPAMTRLDIDEYIHDEWRLAKRLGVDHFRFPPDDRRLEKNNIVPNAGLTIPYVRFPRWHTCGRCGRLLPRRLESRKTPTCPDCEVEIGKKLRMAQVQFVAICEGGHIQDFPWAEWVHRSHSPTCGGPLTLKAFGGATLGAHTVACKACHASRTLDGITRVLRDRTKTYLSTQLGGAEFTCPGYMPWHGRELVMSCDRHLRGSLRSASNVYYGQTRSSIFLPLSTDPRKEALFHILMSGTPRNSVKMAIEAKKVVPDFPFGGLQLKQNHPSELETYTVEEVDDAFGVLLNDPNGQPPPPDGTAPEVFDDDEEAQFRRDELEVLRQPQATDRLKVRAPGMSDYGKRIGRWFTRVMLIDTLEETRALWGLSRVFPDPTHTVEEHKAMLRQAPAERGQRWLPAYVVRGEGILLEVNEDFIATWEGRPEVQQRAQRLADTYGRAAGARQLRARRVSPRLVALHSLSHILMNELTFECGYSSASLRERLYIAPHEARPMAAILIYTAAGDAEGTMGGLVRMGKPGYLERTLDAAVERARWCSADPVCTEIGETTGQGPESCNLSACHSCALVPETSCEEFNKFLDRGLVVGTLADRSLGLLT